MTTPQEPRTPMGKSLDGTIAWHMPRCAFSMREALCDCGLRVRITKIEAEAAAHTHPDVKRIKDRLAMREVSVGPQEAFSKQSVLDVLNTTEALLSEECRPEIDVERLGALISDALDYTDDGLVIAKAVLARLTSSEKVRPQGEER